MSEWKEYKFSDIAEVIGGGTPDTFNVSYWNGDIPWLTPKDLTGYSKIYISKGERNITSDGLKNSSAKLLPKDTVLLTTRAPIGYVAIAENEIATNQGFKNFVLKKDYADCKFVYYWLKNNIDYLRSIGTGTTFAEISGSVVKEIKILLPPLSEQKSIASILSSLDDKIDLLHRQNATLEKMAETLFRQWFVERRPEPVEGKAKEEWEEETFEKWIHETVGGDWGKESIKGDFTKAVCCLRGTDIADLNNGLPNKTPIRFIKENKYQSICPNDGDLIIEVSGGTENQSTGRICYINNQVKTLFNYPLVFSNFCRMIRIKKPEYSFFVYCYIQYLYNQDEFFNLENGSSGIKNLDYKTLLFDLKYKMPDEDSVIKFHNHVKSLFQKVNQNKIQIRTLSTLRDTLLPKLMSGEIRVL
jgi:type I restriction enzyme S subunit